MVEERRDDARAAGFDRAVGIAAGAVAVAIWAGWIVATREATADRYGAALTPADIAFLRFSAPALLLAPWWAGPLFARGRAWPARLSAALRPNGVSTPLLLGVLLWGAPFALAAAAGAARAETAAFSALVPGAMPLWAAALAWAFFSERPAADRRLGLALILAAAALTLTPALSSGTSAGAEIGDALPYLCLAALSWAGFAVAFKRSGLGALQAAGLVGVYSTLLLAPLVAFGPSGLGALSGEALLWQIFVQGFLSGAVSVAAYAVAIERLGPGAAALAALVPPLATLMGWAWLGEAPGTLGWLAVGAAGLGVALANGAARLIGFGPRGAGSRP